MSTNEDLDHRISRLEAKDAIRGLKMSYVRWCDARHPPRGFDALFTQDCVWDGGEVFGRHAGKAAMLRMFEAAVSDISWTLHYVVSGEITVADDLTTAESTWYLWQPLTLQGEPVWNMGRYCDRHVRTADGWLISDLVLTVDTLTHVHRGWVDEPFMSRP